MVKASQHHHPKIYTSAMQVADSVMHLFSSRQGNEELGFGDEEKIWHRRYLWTSPQRRA